MHTHAQKFSFLKPSSSARRCKQFKIAADQRSKPQAHSNTSSPKPSRSARWCKQWFKIAAAPCSKSQAARSNVCPISLPIPFFLPKGPVAQPGGAISSNSHKIRAQNLKPSPMHAPRASPDPILSSQKPSSWLSKAEVQRIQLATDLCSKSQAQSSTCFGRPESSSACYPLGPRSQGFHSSCLSQHRRGPLQN